jgi:agmatinase
MYAIALAFSLLASTAVAREIVFPPIAATQSNQIFLEQDEKVDIVSGSQFSGLTTFAHLPYVNCFVGSEAEAMPYDIAFLGAPFDTVSPYTVALSVRR